MSTVVSRRHRHRAALLRYGAAGLRGFGDEAGAADKERLAGQLEREADLEDAADDARSAHLAGGAVNSSPEGIVWQQAKQALSDQRSLRRSMNSGIVTLDDFPEPSDAELEASEGTAQ